MSTFDDFFGTISWEYRQHLDVERLKREVSGLEGVAVHVHSLQARIEQLELLNKALLELLVNKDLIGRDELSVMMQQLDLLDGVEDGKISPQVHEGARTCGDCGRYINPKRPACVYCGTAIARDPNSAPRPVRMVRCTACGETVTEAKSYYSARGVVCHACFVMLES